MMLSCGHVVGRESLLQLSKNGQCVQGTSTLADLQTRGQVSVLPTELFGESGDETVFLTVHVSYRGGLAHDEDRRLEDG